MGAHVHKTIYGFLIDTALYAMLLMRANPLLKQVGGGWALEIPLPPALAMDLPASKPLHMYGAV